VNSNELMGKASRAAASAKLLLTSGDVDGACNRAYYARFDAARPALFWSNSPVAPHVIKAHSGLISAFSLHLVKTGRLPVELGRVLNRASEIRMIADYTGDEVTEDKALWVIEQAALFVETVRKEMTTPKAEQNDPL
jgi:uncharacterized protein (UPF0332 family)